MDTITHGIVGALVGKALFAGLDTQDQRRVARSPSGSSSISFETDARLKEGATSALSASTARVAIVACTIGSIFPDIDVFAGPLAHNPLAIMEWHRNITHSALMLPLWALILAAVSLPLARALPLNVGIFARREGQFLASKEASYNEASYNEASYKWKSPPFWTLFAIYGAGIGTHIFLDLMTSFGTMVWSPVNYSRPAWDWVFIIDLTLTAIALAPQLIAWCYRDSEEFLRRAIGVWVALTLGAYGAYWFAKLAGYGFPLRAVGVASAIFGGLIFLPAMWRHGFSWTRAGWCRAGLAVLCVYIGMAAAMHHKALGDVQRYAAAEHLPAENVAALPMPPSFTQWVGLISTPEGVWRTTFAEPSGAIQSRQLYADTSSPQIVEQARSLRDVQIYLWFARYPVWQVRKTGQSETVIDISDARFFRRGDPGVEEDPQDPQGPRKVARIPRRRAGFRFEVVLDAQGRVVSHGFTEPE